MPEPQATPKPSRFKRLVRYCLLFLALLLLIGAWVLFHKPHGFDSVKIARAETRMWQAYYTRDYKKLGLELVLLLRHQFGLSYAESLLVARDLATAAATFQPSASGLGNIQQSLESAYARIGRAVGGQWDPRAAARAELAWWVARRTPGHDSVKEVGQDITRLYAILYGRTNPDIEQAGRLRAEAAALRDSGGINADWPRVQNLLEQSYAALVRGVSQPPRP